MAGYVHRLVVSYVHKLVAGSVHKFRDILVGQQGTRAMTLLWTLLQDNTIGPVDRSTRGRRYVQNLVAGYVKFRIYLFPTRSA